MKVLFFEGDPNGVRYVSGTLTRMGVAQELVRPGAPLPRDLSRFQAALISGFPARHYLEIEPLLASAACEGGLGLLMIGGARSFGRGGYSGTRLGKLLPVELEPGDDRVLAPGGVAISPVVHHPIVRGLDFSSPVVICGYNRLVARKPSTTVLAGRTLEGEAGEVYLAPARIPLLVVREGEGQGGRCAALALDLSPPWSGGLTAWGGRPLSLGDEEEVGDQYATFVMNLVRWVAGEETLRIDPPTWEAMGPIPLDAPPPGLRCALRGT
jgi:hypothetical protein